MTNDSSAINSDASGYPPPSAEPAFAPSPAQPAASPPAEDEKPDDGHNWLEIIAATLLGLAAVAIAWSAYQSSLWDGQQAAAQTESVRANGVATDEFQRADGIRNFDQTLFLEVLTTGTCDTDVEEDIFVCDQIFANMSEAGNAAVEEWVDNDELVPFDSESYFEALYTPGEEADALSDAFFAEATVANDNGDKYELASTMLATVLFFAGISIVIAWAVVRKFLLGAASVLLIAAAAYLSTLPLA